jgi:hypothetical protein
MCPSDENRQIVGLHAVRQTVVHGFDRWLEAARLIPPAGSVWAILALALANPAPAVVPFAPALRYHSGIECNATLTC